MDEPIRSSSRSAALRILAGLQLFLGFSGVVPGIMLVIAPDGRLLRMPLSNLQYSPFRDFLVPGLLLAAFLGVCPLLIGFGLLKRPAWRWANALNPFKRYHWSFAGSLAVAAADLIWVAVEVIMLRSFVFLHFLYLAWGLALIVLTLVPAVRHDLQSGMDSPRI